MIHIIGQNLTKTKGLLKIEEMQIKCYHFCYQLYYLLGKAQYPVLAQHHRALRHRCGNDARPRNGSQGKEEKCRQMMVYKENAQVDSLRVNGHWVKMETKDMWAEKRPPRYGRSI